MLPPGAIAGSPSRGRSASNIFCRDCKKELAKRLHLICVIRDSGSGMAVRKVRRNIPRHVCRDMVECGGTQNLSRVSAQYDKHSTASHDHPGYELSHSGISSTLSWIQ